MKSIFGGLIEFESQSKLTEFLKTMDDTTSIKIIEGALEYGAKNGLFSMEESHCMYEALLKIKTVISEKNNFISGTDE